MPRRAPIARVHANAWRRRLHPLLDFLWPTDCAACRAPVDALQRHGVCSACWARLVPLGAAQCPRCALPCPSASDLVPAGAPGGCDACAGRASALDGVTAALAYDRIARALLLRAKIGARRELMAALGAMLAAAAAADARLGRADLVVAVPSHVLARVRRGFDPGAVLARTVARRLGLPLGVGVLARRWRAPTGVKRLGRAGRRRVAGSAFLSRKTLKSRQILLVDDVMTTGATLEACAAALRAAGASAVLAAVWARTPRPGGEKS